MIQISGFPCTLEDVKLLLLLKYNYSSSSPYLVMKLLFKNCYVCVSWKWVTCNLGSFQTPILFGKNPVVFGSYKLPKLSYFQIKSLKIEVDCRTEILKTTCYFTNLDGVFL